MGLDGHRDCSWLECLAARERQLGVVGLGGESLGLSRSGVETTEAGAQQAASRDLQIIVSEARAAEHGRRRLAVLDDD